MEYALITVVVMATIRFSIKPLREYSEKNNSWLGKVAKWLVS